MGHHGTVAAKSGRSGRQNVRDMVLSMAAVIGVGLLAYLFTPHSGGDGVHVVDYGSAAASAKRAAPYPLLAPVGLSAQWRATSVEYKKDGEGHAVWHLGFVTPSGKYAAVEQSDAPKATQLTTVVAGYQADGSSTIDGHAWDRVQGEPYRGLTEATGSATTVVVGTASYDELGQLAQALK